MKNKETKLEFFHKLRDLFNEYKVEIGNDFGYYGDHEFYIDVDNDRICIDSYSGDSDLNIHTIKDIINRIGVSTDE